MTATTLLWRVRRSIQNFLVSIRIMAPNTPTSETYLHNICTHFQSIESNTSARILSWTSLEHRFSCFVDHKSKNIDQLS